MHFGGVSCQLEEKKVWLTNVDAMFCARRVETVVSLLRCVKTIGSKL